MWDTSIIRVETAAVNDPYPTICWSVVTTGNFDAPTRKLASRSRLANAQMCGWVTGEDGNEQHDRRRTDVVADSRPADESGNAICGARDPHVGQCPASESDCVHQDVEHSRAKGE